MEYRFRENPDGATVAFAVAEGAITRLSGGAPVRFDAVTDASLASLVRGATATNRLALYHPGGVFEASIEKPADVEDADAAAFRRLAIAVFRGVEAAHPEMEVAFKVRTGLWWRFGFCAVFFLLGLALFAIFVAEPGGDALNLMLSGLFMALIFGVAGWVVRPWRPDPRVPIAELCRALEETDAELAGGKDG